MDYARLHKIFGGTNEADAARRYSPAKIVRVEKERITGDPDESKISTSHIERQNVAIRMQMRWFTRLTNAFSKKVELHLYAVTLHYAYCNWCRVHTTLSKHSGKPTTPAMAGGLGDRVWSISDFLDLLH